MVSEEQLLLNEIARIREGAQRAHDFATLGPILLEIVPRLFMPHDAVHQSILVPIMDQINKLYESDRERAVKLEKQNARAMNSICKATVKYLNSMSRVSDELDPILANLMQNNENLYNFHYHILVINLIFQVLLQYDDARHRPFVERHAQINEIDKTCYVNLPVKQDDIKEARERVYWKGKIKIWGCVALIERVYMVYVEPEFELYKREFNGSRELFDLYKMYLFRESVGQKIDDQEEARLLYEKSFDLDVYRDAIYQICNFFETHLLRRLRQSPLSQKHCSSMSIKLTYDQGNKIAHLEVTVKDCVQGPRFKNQEAQVIAILFAADDPMSVVEIAQKVFSLNEDEEPTDKQVTSIRTSKKGINEEFRSWEFGIDKLIACDYKANMMITHQVHKIYSQLASI